MGRDCRAAARAGNGVLAAVLLAIVALMTVRRALLAGRSAVEGYLIGNGSHTSGKSLNSRPRASDASM
jgi:hypothetical protein